MHPFDADIALTPAAPGSWTGRAESRWYARGSANGGFLAAMVIAAMRDAVDDDTRRPRSLTLHYLRPVVEGGLDVDVTIERSGRSLTTLSGRIGQGGRVAVIALAAFATDRDGVVEFSDVTMPSVPPWTEIEPMQRDSAPPFWQHLEARPVWGGAPFTGSDAAEAGGWIRLDPPRPVDASTVALLTDAWFPAIFTRTRTPLGVPTVDLTIHFRAEPPMTTDPCLVRFQSRLSANGFVEEDGEVWSSDGRLLAQSRQLALAVAGSPG